MAKATAEEKPETTSMVIDRDFAKQIKAIAEDRGVSMSEALEQIAGAIIAREHRKIVEREYAQTVLGGEA